MKGCQNDGSLDYLMSPIAIRDCATKIADLTRQGDGVFILNESRLEIVAEQVVDSIFHKYPTLNIPLHSRGDISRLREQTVCNDSIMRLLNTQISSLPEPVST